MIETFVHREARCPIANKTIQAVAEVAARYEKKIHGEVTVICVGSKRMRQLNYQQRGIDRPTDVLSFGWQEKISPGDKHLLGEIFLCYDYIAQQAKRFGVTVREEFNRMLVHGLLHSVGYDHVSEKEAKKMFKLQEKIVAHS